MSKFELSHLADDSLVASADRLVATDHHHTALILAHIGEIRERRLYAAAGHHSMRDYCATGSITRRTRPGNGSAPLVPRASTPCCSSAWPMGG